MLIQITPRDSATFQTECTADEAAEMAGRATVHVVDGERLVPFAEWAAPKPAAAKKPPKPAAAKVL